ncbi:MAG: Endonuclease [Candidatus Kaiserbacteria bacterium]|nr:Endonuclease [Candidatus Kaiserbacteria bacterium]
MKLISLNTWGGRVAEPLKNFITAHADIDAFLFQEVFRDASDQTRFEEAENPHLFEDISDFLPDHVGVLAPVHAGEWGNAAFIKRSVSIEESGEVYVHLHKDSMIGRDAATLGRSIQWLRVKAAERSYSLLNFHGLWTGIDKNDTAARLEQSRKILELLQSINGEYVLAGDFNLSPNTESLRILEEGAGLRNLIKENGITGTRTSFYTKSERFADYTFVSPGIKVLDFKVLPDEVSDHSAMYIEFE